MRCLPILLPTLLAIGLGGCGSGAADKEPSPQPVASIEATAAPVPAAPVLPAAAPGDALAIAAENYAAGESPLTLVDGDTDQSARSFDVVDCNEEARGVDPNGAQPPHDEVVARRVALLRRSLRLVGYSPAVIEVPLADYARDAARADDPDRRQEGYARLATALDRKRAMLHPDLPPVRAEGGCGAAEVPIIVQSRPAGGRVWLITKFAFDLCNARRLNAWDRIACDRWSEVGADRPVQLSGSYVYQAEWPGGRRARGNRRIDPVADEDDGDKPQIITVDQS